MASTGRPRGSFAVAGAITCTRNRNRLIWRIDGDLIKELGWAKGTRVAVDTIGNDDGKIMLFMSEHPSGNMLQKRHDSDYYRLFSRSLVDWSPKWTGQHAAENIQIFEFDAPDDGKKFLNLDLPENV